MCDSFNWVTANGEKRRWRWGFVGNLAVPRIISLVFLLLICCWQWSERYDDQHYGMITDICIRAGSLYIGTCQNLWLRFTRSPVVPAVTASPHTVDCIILGVIVMLLLFLSRKTRWRKWVFLSQCFSSCCMKSAEIICMLEICKWCMFAVSNNSGSLECVWQINSLSAIKSRLWVRAP